MTSLKMAAVPSLLILLFLQPAFAHSGHYLITTNETCCYGGDVIENAGLIASFPNQCMQIFCHDGQYEEVYYDSPLDCSCCEFDGKMYRNGQKIAAICIDITCVNGKWETNGRYDPCCSKCIVQGDPYITTFDGRWYPYHGTCNYSVSQLSTDYDPHFGIYGQFKPCWIGSCVHMTTFTDNPNTVIQYTHGASPSVTVNGAAYSAQDDINQINVGGLHPVLAWKNGNNIMFLGSQGYLVMLGSTNINNYIEVWAYPNLLEQVHGLCGYYNQYKRDDYKMRNGIVADSQTFANDWRTSQQTDSSCDGAVTPTPLPVCDEDDMAHYHSICVALLLEVSVECKRENVAIIFNNSVAGCASDLCIMTLGGANATEIEAWKLEMMATYKVIIEIECHTGDPDPEPCDCHEHVHGPNCQPGCSGQTHVNQMVQFIFKSKKKH